MNIHLLAFHRALHFGAVLQVTALSHVLSRLLGSRGQVFVYDYQNPHEAAQYPLFRPGSLRETLSQAIQLPAACLQRARFHQFLRDHVALSTHFGPEDRFIVGGDQVWNPSISQYDPTFLLQFLPDGPRKNAYAASLGSDHFGSPRLPLSVRQDFYFYLRHFAHLSVREKSAALLLGDLLQREIPVHLDPNALLSFDEWTSFAKPVSTPSEYIFYYAVKPHPEMSAFAQKLSQNLGLPILAIAPHGLRNPFKKAHPQSRFIHTAGPAEWLSLMQHAQAVVTHSFHGALFATQFKKSVFIHQINALETDPALVQLIERFDLHEASDQAPSKLMPAEANAIDQILAQERSLSLEYLRQLIDS